MTLGPVLDSCGGGGAWGLIESIGGQVMKLRNSFRLVAWLLSGGTASLAAANPVHGGLTWRGPQQNGSLVGKGLPADSAATEALWVADFPGQSTPVIANGKLYIMGYLGEGPDMREGVTCFDAETGQKLWEHLYNDFLSDTIYQRYATSSATVDEETGDVF